MCTLQCRNGQFCKSWMLDWFCVTNVLILVCSSHWPLSRCPNICALPTCGWSCLIGKGDLLLTVVYSGRRICGGGGGGTMHTMLSGANAQVKHSHTHLLGLRTLSLACSRPCQRSRFCWRVVSKLQKLWCHCCTLMRLVSSMNASMNCMNCFEYLGLVTIHGVTIDLYARIKLLTWTTQWRQALPAPWLATYHGSLLECWLYWVDIPIAGLHNNACAVALPHGA